MAACLPFFIADSITGTCHSHGVAVKTRSRSSVSHEPLEVARALVVDGRRRMAGLGDLFGRPVRALGPDVADRGDPAAGNLQEVLHVTAALQADADEADADGLDRRRANCAL